jgi:leucyl-tRNA synthetase/very-short-patch-repair endonuclease
MEYDFRKIEQDWQKKWKDNKVYSVSNESAKPKYYVLDMFPYPSGAGLHVGHPLGYIASDIYSRYKRLKGFNVLHPMGFDSFGLPAEQYALETGQHPAETTKKNIATFKSQLDKIGFCYDWEREVQTSDPNYYKWTQWIFLQLFNSYFCNSCKQAKPITELIKKYETKGGSKFTAQQWNAFSTAEKEEWLMQRRLAFSKYGEVNWCEALGTVLANDEVVNGVSERGGHPVEKKKMRQWYLRITAYADRLLEGLETVEFSESMKEMQRNWIGKSQGAEIQFAINNSQLAMTVYTTRPDTIFGVNFMVVAPELDLVQQIKTPEQTTAVDEYIAYVKSRSDVDRMAEKKITGCFTGAYAINPFDGKQIPIWISEYVLAGYGTGAIMAVPCGDERDFKFAQHFKIPITNIIGTHFNGQEANATKEAILENSDFLNGIKMMDATNIVLQKLEEKGIGKRKVNYRMRDAGFSRQRYWGEPFPIVWSDGIAVPLDADELPLELPHVDKYGPGPNGEGPLANLKEWTSSPSLLQVLEKGGGKNVAEKEKKGASPVPKYKVGTPMQYEFAKQMRKDFTEAENHLWQEVRGNKLDVKFRRQHPVENYIVDFVSLQDALIVEADGGYHESAEQKIYDDERTKVLNEIGFTVLRFSNEEIINNTQKVISTIKNTLQKSGSHGNKENIEGSGFSHPSPRSGEGQGVRETSTMPGYAGSSWYFLRYMDPHNKETFCGRKASDYWNQVDLYIGGTEHAVGHLLYSRLWTKVLYDLGHIGFDEPFKKLLNQGMITGISKVIWRRKYDAELENTKESFESSALDLYDDISRPHLFHKFYSIELVNKFGKNHFVPLNVPIHYVDGDIINPKLLIDKWKERFDGAYITENGYYFNGRLKIKEKESIFSYSESSTREIKFFVEAVIEKMSKSKLNAENPDDIIVKYGADTFRMYEMFLGPVEASKPWDTKGIEGVHRFLKKLWRLFNSDPSPSERGRGEVVWTDEKATDAELKILHRTIKKIEEDTEKFSFNTAVSAFMICVNDLFDAKCHKKEILEQLLILLTPYAPHIAEELWHQLGNTTTILDADYPKFNAALLVESSKEYPVSINGKVRTNINLSLDLQQADVEKIIAENEVVQKWLEGKAPKRVIYVKNKMINVVV